MSPRSEVQDVLDAADEYLAALWQPDETHADELLGAVTQLLRRYTGHLRYDPAPLDRKLSEAPWESQADGAVWQDREGNLYADLNYREGYRVAREWAEHVLSEWNRDLEAEGTGPIDWQLPWSVM